MPTLIAALATLATLLSLASCGSGAEQCSGATGGGECDECDVNWAGPNCDECDSGHFGTNCMLAVTCQNGTCAAGDCFGTVGVGTCTSCNPGWGGVNCDCATAPDDPFKCQPALADYAATPREEQPRVDGLYHVDSALLTSRLVELGVNTYAFLILQPTDWDDLGEFLPMADAAGIDVWVYLIPPAELFLVGGDYRPFLGDYVAWGDAIGSLAAEWPGLEAFVMDDFNGDLDTFTPTYTQEMVDAARAHRPDIRFYAIDYFDNVLQDFLTRDYRSSVDGIILPYFDLDTTMDLRPQLELISRLATEQLSIRFGYPFDTPSSAGDYVRYTLSCAPDGDAGHVSFDYYDSYHGPTEGYRVAYLWYAGQNLWGDDAAGRETPAQVAFDFAPANGAELVIELFDKQAVSNFPLEARFSNLQVHGCGDASSGSWTASTNNGAFTASIGTTADYPGFDLFAMIYATSTSWHPELPTADYVSGGVGIALDAWSDGLVDGVITYGLDKRSTSGETFSAVRDQYSAY